MRKITVKVSVVDKFEKFWYQQTVLLVWFAHVKVAQRPFTRELEVSIALLLVERNPRCVRRSCSFGWYMNDSNLLHALDLILPGF